MSEVACRACRSRLTDSKGCHMCTPWKRHLVVIGDQPEDRVDLGDLTTEALNLARSRLRLLRKWGADDPRYTHKEAMELIKTIAITSDSARKIRKEGAAAVNSMTFQERAELFVSWYGELPPAHRDYLQQKLRAAANEDAPPLIESASLDS